MLETNKKLKENGHNEMKFGDFLGQLRCWFIVQVHPGHDPKDFFSIKPIDECWNTPQLGDAMSGKRFERMSACLKLDDEEKLIEYNDRLFWTRKLSENFKDNMDTEFNTSWLVCTDESTVFFS